ncbi:hypothetical protein AB1046_20885 [Promicromonospora sp. Populi]|uniref:hypothetical protein n=1 Tax=Promicromonospora sp. Populi TaxID=3239420 RepID=UPI0034E29080
MSQDIADSRTYEIVGPAVFCLRVGPGGRPVGWHAHGSVHLTDEKGQKVAEPVLVSIELDRITLPEARVMSMPTL